jgi:hypothetical protein
MAHGSRRVWRAVPVAALATAVAALAAAPAHATLAYVKGAGSSTPRVYGAADDGTQPRKLGEGLFPAVSPDGRWVAWIAPDGKGAEQAMLAAADGSAEPTAVVRSRGIGQLTFSPDSAKLAIVRSRRLTLLDVAEGTTATVARAAIQGFSFSPDSRQIAYGSSGRTEDAFAPSDLYVADLATGARQRITRDRKSLHPVWGPDGGIVFDRLRARTGDAPALNLWWVKPDGGSLRRLTNLRIPKLVSGLMPLEWSADGRRLLSQFVGQDTAVAFAVSPRSGRTRALAKDVEGGFVATDLSADGRTVLGQTGGPGGADGADVVTVPYAGGKPTLLVKAAAYPDWSR